jgi:hypothetical protein
MILESSFVNFPLIILEVKWSPEWAKLGRRFVSSTLIRRTILALCLSTGYAVTKPTS